MKTSMMGAALALAMTAGGLRAETVDAYVDGVTVTSKALAAALADYVAAESTVKGGVLLVEDAELKSVLWLKPESLDKGAHIHRVAEKLFLSWGKFKDADGNLYFLDFYFAPADDGRLKPAAPLTIYSRNEVKRYDWDESGAIMKKLPAPKPKK